MAQTSSLYNAPLSGNLGNQTYKNYGGKQVVTARFHTTSAKGEGASRAQRDTRMLLPNLTLIGSSIRPWLPALWESNKFFKRPYTHFISHNMKRGLLVLPKSLIDMRKCCWGELQVSCGTLPTIPLNFDSNDNFVTNIQVSSSLPFDNQSWGIVSKYIIEHNADYLAGDSLVFIRVTYWGEYVAAGVIPYYSTSVVTALTLDPESTDVVRNSFRGPVIGIVGVLRPGNTYSLGIPYSGGSSLAIVHVRKSRGQYLSSSQVMSLDALDADFFRDMQTNDYLRYCAGTWGYRDKIL